MKNYIMLLLCLGLTNTALQSNISKEMYPNMPSNMQLQLAGIKCNNDLFSIFPNLDVDKVKRLIAAILWQESANGKYLTGDGGRAKGVLQQHTCIITDVNNYLGESRYTIADRNDPVKAVELFMYYQAIYNPGMDIEKAARVWNGGPSGHLKSSTLDYWDEVQTWMNCSISMENSIIHELEVFKTKNYQV